MKTDLSFERPEGGGLMPVESSSKNKTCYPTLNIDLDEKSQGLIDDLGKEGTAKITYTLKRLSIGDQGYPEGSTGCVTLEIKSIEPMDSKSSDDSEENDENMDAEDALDQFMKSNKKNKKSY